MPSKIGVILFSFCHNNKEKNQIKIEIICHSFSLQSSHLSTFTCLINRHARLLPTYFSPTSGRTFGIAKGNNCTLYQTHYHAYSADNYITTLLVYSVHINPCPFIRYTLLSVCLNLCLPEYLCEKVSLLKQILMYLPTQQMKMFASLISTDLTV